MYNEQKMDLINGLNNHVDHADADYSQGRQAIQIPVVGLNPKFKATFTLKFLTTYYTLTGSVYTKITPVALDAALKNDLPFFVYGFDDFEAGFKKIQSIFQINSNWTYGRAGIFGKDDFNEFGFDATVTSDLQDGDMVIPFTSALPGAGTTTLALHVIRCSEVAYGSLLAALASDTFGYNGVRYIISDDTQIDQFANQITFLNLSIFGKFDQDQITPNDYKKPEQFQDGIIDVPIPSIGNYGNMDKHKSVGFFSIFTLETQSWTIFVPRVNKLIA